MLVRQAFRRKGNWVAAVIVERMASVLRLYARGRSRREQDRPTTWRRALLLGASHIGDILYRSCSFGALKKGLSDCEVYHLVTPAESEVLRDNPFVNGILPWMVSDTVTDMTPDRVEELRRMEFDAVLATSSIRYWPELSLAVRLGVPNRVGYVHKGFSGWVTAPVPIHYPQAFPIYFRDYVSHLTGMSPEWSVEPKVYLNTAILSEVDAAWAAAGFRSGDPVLACFMTTRQRIKSLPADLIGRILKELTQRTRVRLALLGAAGDAELLRTVDRQYNLNARVCAGSLSIRGLYGFVSRCTAVISTDSGPRHLANAAGVPVFFFRNLWSNAVETGAYLDSEVDLCPPGLQYLSDAEYRRVLEDLSASDVLDTILRGVGDRLG